MARSPLAARENDQSAAPVDRTAARLIIDLDALAANYRTLKAATGGAEVAAVVKADGYGLGAAPVARRLWTEGARSFFVARVSEGELLRAALARAPGEANIFVLDGCPPGAAPRLSAASLVPALNSTAQLEDWAAHARALGRPLSAALHVDTGLNRLGLRLEEVGPLLATPDRLRGVQIDLVMSHLGCASEPGHEMNRRQVERFRDLAELFPTARKSLANSAGAFLGPPYRFDMVRPGVALYGGGPFDRPDPRLQPVATVLAPILQVRSVPPGESIGYGATYSAREPRRVAVVAAGYADGVPRAESPRGFGWFAGARRPLLGRISMDLIALDVTGADGAIPGAEVELLGPQVPLDLAAAAAGTIGYELLVRLSGRLQRTYLGEAS